MVSTLSIAQIWEALEDVKDPEIPVVSVVEMGIVRDVTMTEAGVRVTMTPTFSGCPALHVMQREIAKRLNALGLENVEVVVALSPRWTTDWITEEARAKLKAFGLAPPTHLNGQINVFFEEPATCPYCGSQDTSVKNTFGPTLCRALYYCRACQQPFEQFKAL
jgi:ring-1,2-phenylacetyl-CoA epoxidase subunit PaaD